MKKVLLAVIAMVVVGMSSCQKEEGATPQVQTQTHKVADKKDTSGWD